MPGVPDRGRRPNPVGGRRGPLAVQRVPASPARPHVLPMRQQRQSSVPTVRVHRLRPQEARATPRAAPDAGSSPRIQMVLGYVVPGKGAKADQRVSFGGSKKPEPFAVPRVVLPCVQTGVRSAVESGTQETISVRGQPRPARGHQETESRRACGAQEAPKDQRQRHVGHGDRPEPHVGRSGRLSKATGPVDRDRSGNPPTMGYQETKALAFVGIRNPQPAHDLGGGNA
jgi:hypothetical protein